ncbi:MAG TPA: ATPase, T2SS/T4P/T4SS family, partial [Microbacteriaceae bacterium]|nr:ATPase, T2SS/T4P/T4SS family [Microbacteriaceae bacterium]
ERALRGTLPVLADEAGAQEAIVATITGYGPLQPYLDDPGVEEIWINRPDRVFVARGGVAERVAVSLTAEQVRDLVERMLQSTGRRVDHSMPFVDASLPDGSRLHVAIADVVRDWSVNIRKFNRSIRDLDTLVRLGALPALAAEFLRASVAVGLNILVCGATQSGKTTLLNALLSAVGPTERIVTVEETFELDLDVEDVVAMQCRQPSLEGVGEITLRRLIKEALRMRPDRIIVGEVREAESLDLLIALNAGLPGACTLHANGTAEALAKLCTLPLLAGRNISADFIVPTVARSVDLVIFCRMEAGGRRRIVEISATDGPDGRGGVMVRPLFCLVDGELAATGALPGRLEPFRARGIDLHAMLTPAAPAGEGRDALPGEAEIGVPV